MPSKRFFIYLAVAWLVFSIFCLLTTLCIYTIYPSSKAESPKNSANSFLLRIKRQQFNACNNYTQITHINEAKFRDKYKVDPPWSRSSKFFSSKNLLYNWNWLRENKIRGLGIPLSSVIAFFDNNKCLFMPWNEAVRNLLLSAEPIPISAELGCSLTRIYSLCKVRFTRSFCHRLPNTSYVLLGDPFDNKSSLGEILNEPLRLFSWKTLSARAKHELDYNVNALGLYDDYAGKVFLIDLTGKGFADACGKIIRAIEEPLSSSKSWNQGNTFYKALRMYDLLSYDLISTYEQQVFVSSVVKRMFSAEKFEQFYCENICEGFYVSSHSNLANGPFCYLGLQRLSDLSRRIDKFKATLRADFQNTLYSQMEASISRISFVNGKLPSSSFALLPESEVNVRFEDEDDAKKAESSIHQKKIENSFMVVRLADQPPASTSIPKNPTSTIINTPQQTSWISSTTASTATTTALFPTPKTSNPTTTSTTPQPQPTTTRPTLTDDDFGMIYYTFTTYKYYNFNTPKPHVDFSWKK